jgi:hypothetical protein
LSRVFNTEPVVVVISANEFKLLSRPKESVIQFFAPLRNSGTATCRANSGSDRRNGPYSPTRAGATQHQRHGAHRRDNP